MKKPLLKNFRKNKYRNCRELGQKVSMTRKEVADLLLFYVQHGYKIVGESPIRELVVPTVNQRCVLQIGKIYPR